MPLRSGGHSRIASVVIRQFLPGPDSRLTIDHGRDLRKDVPDSIPTFRLNPDDESSFVLSDHLPQLGVFGESR